MFRAYELPSDFARVARAARVTLAKGFFDVSYKHCAPNGAKTLQPKRFTKRTFAKTSGELPLDTYGWPKRARYSGDEMNASTISAFTKLPLNWFNLPSQNA